MAALLRVVEEGQQCGKVVAIGEFGLDNDRWFALGIPHICLQCHATHANLQDNNLVDSRAHLQIDSQLPCCRDSEIICIHNATVPPT